MRLDVPRDLSVDLRREIARAGRVEIGGVLMAEQVEPGHFRLMDFSVDSKRGGAAHFVRSVKDLEEAMSRFFERTGSDYGRYNYLGEWHSHPNHLPLPSSEDIEAMTDLVNGERDIPFAVLLIAKRRLGGLASSVTLFQRGIWPEPVRVRET